jgi:hypothetical protein
MNELPNKHSAIVNAKTVAELDRLDKEVDIANRKALPVLKQLDTLMSVIDNNYDSRFGQLLKKVVQGGGRSGGFRRNWQEGMARLHKEMMR